MTEEQYRRSDLILKTLGSLGVIVTFLVGIYQYNDTAEKEFRKQFWEKQLELYLEASRAAAQLSIIQQDSLREPVYRRFLELYHGEMVLVEDEAVKDSMKSFVEMYIDYRDDPGLQDELQASARALARTCRKSLAESWNLELQELDFATY